MSSCTLGRFLRGSQRLRGPVALWLSCRARFLPGPLGHLPTFCPSASNCLPGSWPPSCPPAGRQPSACPASARRSAAVPDLGRTRPHTDFLSLTRSLHPGDPVPVPPASHTAIPPFCPLISDHFNFHEQPLFARKSQAAVIAESKYCSVAVI